MHRSAYMTEVLRSIRGSLGRFLAIMGIVALGCGFYAGLRMTGPDMRAAADRWYDGTELWDLRLVSTLGFTDEDVESIADTEGVSAAMPARSTDAMADVGGEQVAVRITSIDADAAEGSAATSDFEVESDDADYLNRPRLVSGRWPTKAGECVVSADATGCSVEVGDTIEVLYATEDLDGLLAETELEVVGTVSSSDYPYTGTFGSTSLGTGQIDQYLYVTDDTFAADLPYTEVYLKVAGADGLESGSEDYEDAVDEVRDRLEDETDALAESRRDDLRSEAQAELDEQAADLEAQRTETYGQLDEAKAGLDSAKEQIDAAEAALAEKEAEYESGLSSYEQQRASAEEQLAEGESSWQSGVDELLSALSSEGVQASDLSGARTALEAKASEADAGIASLESAVEEADATVGELEQLVDVYDQLDQLRAAEAEGTSEDAEALAQEIAGLEATVRASGMTREEAEDALAEAKGSRDEAQSQLEALRSSRQQISSSLDAVAQLEQGRSELDASRSQAESELAAAKEQLDSAAEQISSARSQLDTSRAEYEEGLAEYQAALDEADQSFADAEERLADAQDEVDSIDLPDIYVLDRSESEGAATYEADTERMDNIAAVFPAMFFLVAALVALTTMTRMVEDDRVQIGTYKALGYGKGRIAAKYLLYALVAGGVGAVVGILVLSQVLPYIIMSAYSIIYVVPEMQAPLPVDLGIALSSGLLGVGVTLAATLLAVLSSLRSTPATLMLPRSPKAGKRILLERVTPLWRRLSFSWKVTCRNIFRYKRRLLMTVIGIAGCTALLLVGFGLHDSIWDIIDRQYGPIIHYDTTVGLDDAATEEDVSRVTDYLESTGEASDVVRAQCENMQAEGTGASSGATETTQASVVIPKDAEGFSEAVTFRSRETGDEVAFDDDTVLVTEKLASLHGIEVGDKIVLYEQDAVGRARGEGYELTVDGIVENYVGNTVYVGRDAWADVTGDEAVFSTIYADTTDDADERDEITDELHDLPDVSTVVYSDETIDTYRHMLTVVDMIVVVLIVSAGALAFIVLYNLTNINIAERVREIASLKVLGFTRREVYSYVYREIVLLAVLGDLLGLVLGTWLETFVITTAEVDYVMFGREIHPASYAFAFALTIVFTVLILALMRRKLDRVDMVESLKSVD